MRSGLALIAGAGLLIAAPVEAEMQTPAVPVEAGQAALPWLKLEELSATRDRPLFAPDRRPPPAPPPVVAPAVGAPLKEEVEDTGPNLSLRGIIRQGATTLIVLEDNTTSKSIVLRSGDSYGRWRVSAESHNSVKLADGSQELRLQLFGP